MYDDKIHYIISVLKQLPRRKISIVMFDRQRQVMTTMSEIVLVVCSLVREQLLQYMVAIIQYTLPKRLLSLSVASSVGVGSFV